MRKKGWLVSLSHKLISMADDPEQQGSNRASLAQQFLKAASFSNHSPGNKKVKIVFSKKSLGMQLCFFFHFSYCIHILNYLWFSKKLPILTNLCWNFLVRSQTDISQNKSNANRRHLRWIWETKIFPYQSHHPWKIQFCPLIRMVMVQQHQHDNILKFLPVKWNAEKSFYFVLNY